MQEFRNYHPLVNFIYFVFVFGFSCVFLHPVSLIISIVCAFVYSVVISGIKAVRFALCTVLPLMVISAVINPAFNHQGITILGYFPSGNPFTAESVAAGLATALMLGSVILWFSCYNAIMTSDKFIYLFGKIIPSLSLVLSMVLRFVPKFKAQIKEIAVGQRGIGMDVSTGNVWQRAKNGMKIISVMVSWSMENAIDTADSMKSRGYGLPGRTTFSNFRFSGRDGALLGIIMGLGVYVLAGALLGAQDYQYFPYMKGVGLSFWTGSVFVAYFMLCITPVIVEIKEERKWKLLRSKI